jgi:tetratricopeptide (TPR) repeat protein
MAKRITKVPPKIAARIARRKGAGKGKNAPSKVDAGAPPRQALKGGARPPAKDGPLPPDAMRLFSHAAKFHHEGNLAAAERGYVAALRINPYLSEAYNNLGVLLRRQGKREAAAASYRRALAINPEKSSFLSNLGNVLRELGQFDAAAACHRKAIELSPDKPEPICNLGIVLRDMGHRKEALACFDAAITLRADYVEAHWDRSLILLQNGDLQSGFKEYEWRWRLPNNPNSWVNRKRWDGADLDGRKILLTQEKGMGDMIQMVRYAPLVKARGAASVIVECVAPLGRLLGSAPGVDKVFIKDGSKPAFDVYMPMMSLPNVLGTSTDSIPGPPPYVSPPSIHNLKFDIPKGIALKVGIVWAGKPTHQNDRNRSCPLAHFIKLAGFLRVAFYSLQKGPRAADLADAGADGLIVTLDDRLNDFADTAAVMAQLDLIISVDTAVVHLAGALGREVWTLLPFTSDWRWLADRDDSPWYPSMRLFRQDKPDDWDGIFRKVTAALSEKIKAAAGKAP